MAKNAITKICPKCKETKAVSKFNKCKSRKDKLQVYCKNCSAIVNKKWVKENPIKNRLKTKKDKLKQNYGLTLAEYDKMFEAQKGVCAICGQPETRQHQGGVVWRLAVDHRHSDKKVRGLLCSCCNTALGLFKDNKEILLKAVLYLETNE